MQTMEIPSLIDGDTVTAAALSGTGLLALGTAGGRVTILDENLRPWRGGWDRSAGASAISHLAFSSDGSALAGAIEGSLLVWRLDAQEASDIPIEGAPSAIALSSDGRQLAATSFNVLIFDVLGEAFVNEFEQEIVEGGIGEYEAVAFTPDSGTVVATSEGGVDAWSLETRERVRPPWSCECGADGAAFSTDAALVAFGTADAHVLLWDVSSAELVKGKTVSVEAGDHVYGTAVSLNGTRVLAGTASGWFLVWEPRADAILGRARPSGQPIVRAEASNDGRVFLVEGQKAEVDVEPGERDRWLVRLVES